jgi:hypothetical protein
MHTCCPFIFVPLKMYHINVARPLLAATYCLETNPYD